MFLTVVPNLCYFTAQYNYDVCLESKSAHNGEHSIWQPCIIIDDSLGPLVGVRKIELQALSHCMLNLALILSKWWLRALFGFLWSIICFVGTTSSPLSLLAFFTCLRTLLGSSKLTLPTFSSKKFASHLYAPEHVPSHIEVNNLKVGVYQESSLSKVGPCGSFRSRIKKFFFPFKLNWITQKKTRTRLVSSHWPSVNSISFRSTDSIERNGRIHCSNSGVTFTFCLG